MTAELNIGAFKGGLLFLTGTLLVGSSILQNRTRIKNNFGNFSIGDSVHYLPILEFENQDNDYMDQWINNNTNVITGWHL